ncbi:MAG: hypothetical protein ACLQFW_25860, partial [Xanthobacteraceae bacterium]
SPLRSWTVWVAVLDSVESGLFEAPIHQCGRTQTMRLGLVAATDLNSLPRPKSRRRWRPAGKVLAPPTRCWRAIQITSQVMGAIRFEQRRADVMWSRQARGRLMGIEAALFMTKL